MSYENDKAAFDRTAHRLQKAAKASGRRMSHDEAKKQLRQHLKNSNKK
jgi:hypothetical protein